MLGSWLKLINKLMTHFPGAGNNPPFNEQDLKRICYNLMLEDWQLNFLTTGRDFADAAYTFDMMIRQFELLENIKRDRKAND